MVAGIVAVGLHRQCGRVNALVAVGAGLFQDTKIAGGVLRHGHKAGKTVFPQVIQDDFFDHFRAFKMELVSAFSLRAA